MEVKGLLEVIQVQRHDFLNHLQVISGLLQLGKADRVRDYITQVCGDYERLSRITRLKSEDVKAVLLIANLEAAKVQVELDYDIQSNLANLSAPGHIVGTALERCIRHALKFLSPPQITDRRIKLSITEGDRKITIKLGFPGVPAEVVKDANVQMVLSQFLASHEGSVKLAVTDKGAEIYMIFQCTK